MTIATAYVVAPMLAAAKVVVLLFAGMAGKARLGNLFRRLVLERDYLLRIAFFGVSFTRTVASLAARDLSFPATDFGKLSV